MKKKGSVTVFFSLFMAVFLVLIQIMFRSVQMAGGKIQAEAGVEEGLYSVFAGYDRELFEKYHVFFLDGGYGTGTLQPGRMYQKVEDSFVNSCNPGNRLTGIRGENLWKCSKESGAVTGFTLASDQQGRAFKLQAIDYMKETAGIQGIQLLLEKADAWKRIVETQEREGSSDQVKEAQKAYEQAKEQAEQQAAEQQMSEQRAVGQQTAGQQTAEPPGEGQASSSADRNFVNPLEVIGQLQKRGILGLVLPADAEISQGKFDGTGRMSQRACEKGMGVLHYGENPDTITGNLIFQEYMVKHLSCYGISGDTGGISYQLEYVIAGKETDQENLKAVVTRLLAMREAANLVYLIKNPACQAQIHELALVICTGLGFPALEGIVSLALQAAWAFGESVLDVRQLLNDGKVPLVKTSESWMLSLENLDQLPQLLNQSRNQGKKQSGLSYQEYLRILLGIGKTEQQVIRTMDVAEQTIRAIQGKEKFRLDLCVSYLQVEIQASCREYHFTIQRDYGYEM